jgi:hypothetical protein
MAGLAFRLPIVGNGMDGPKRSSLAAIFLASGGQNCFGLVGGQKTSLIDGTALLGFSTARKFPPSAFGTLFLRMAGSLKGQADERACSHHRHIISLTRTAHLKGGQAIRDGNHPG